VTPRDVNRARRSLLAAIPALALAAAACGSKPGSPGVISPPEPGTPDEALKVLLDGNGRFAARTPEIREVADIDALWSGGIASKQEPFAMVLGCADSRLAPEIIFDQFVGDIFVVREAGNIAESPTNIGSLEYGQAVLHAKVLVVLGHSDCGAINAAFTGAAPGGNIQAIVNAIKPGISGASDLGDAVVRNVIAVIAHVRANSQLLREAEKSGGFGIVGAVYDIKTAKVRVL
jgi:carbonic anhydrase